MSTTPLPAPAPAVEPIGKLGDAAARTCPDCNRTLPIDAEHFHKSHGGFRTRCKDCVNAAEREARARARRGEARRTGRPTDADRERWSAAGVDPARPSLVERADALAELAALDSIVAELIGEPAPQIPGGPTTPERRRALIQLRRSMAPPGGEAEAVAGIGPHMAAANDYVRELRAHRVNFDALVAALAEPELGGNPSGASAAVA